MKGVMWKMLGIDDLTILAAYLLSVASALLCLAYGISKWNSYD